MASQIFTGNNTWTATFTGTINADIYSKGGSGADGAGGNGGGGGGGSGHVSLTAVPVTLGTSYNVYVYDAGFGAGYFSDSSYGYAGPGNSGIGSAAGAGGNFSLGTLGSAGTYGGNGGFAGGGTEGAGGGQAGGPAANGVAGGDGSIGTPGTGGTSGNGNIGSGVGAGGDGSGGNGKPYGGGAGGGGFAGPGSGTPDPGGVVLTWSYPAPMPTSMSPNQGTTIGGTSVTIYDNTNHSFSTGSTVTFDGVPATSIVVVDDSTISCVSPARSSSGTVAVTVENPDNTSGNDVPGGFAYLGPGAAGLLPVGGTTAGGTQVTITGYNFTTGSTVTIGGVSCTSVVVTPGNLIVCNTGAHSAVGTVDVVVTDTAGATSTITNGFCYFSSRGSGGSTVILF